MISAKDGSHRATTIDDGITARAAHGKLPDFVCVGPGRAGTSWLYEVLLEHPDVYLAKDIKETQFFNDEWHRGLAWYCHFFEHSGSNKICGEVSNRYFIRPEVPHRIWSTMPHCKLIVCLRNPYDRLVSIYSFKLREGAIASSFSEAVQNTPALVYDTCYSTFLEGYLQYFSKEQIFFMLYDDLVNNPSDLCRRLFRFIGVREDYQVDSANRVVNRAIMPRWKFAGSASKRLARWLRSNEMYSLLTWAKRSETIKALLFKPFPVERMNLFDLRTATAAATAFEPDIDRLEAITGRDLSNWRRR